MKTKKQILNLLPKEDEEQKALAIYLNHRFGYYGWIHVPNQRWAKPQYLRKLAAMGVKKGFPDIIIFYRSTTNTFHGAVIEMKRQKGGNLTGEQRDWAAILQQAGWAAIIAKGAQDAIRQIEEIYGKH